MPLKKRVARHLQTAREDKEQMAEEKTKWQDYLDSYAPLKDFANHKGKSRTPEQNFDILCAIKAEIHRELQHIDPREICITNIDLQVSKNHFLSQERVREIRKEFEEYKSIAYLTSDG